MSRRTIAVVIAAILLAGCGPTQDSSPSPSPSVSVPKPQVSSDFVNRLDGSTATIPLGSAVMTALTGSDDGMVFNKTDVAYENLINGSKDLILVTYPSEEEFKMASDAGIELDVIPVVKDALVFLVNTGNTVDNLTQDQVKDIYTGTTTNWDQVGGADAEIIPYQRQVNSGSQTLFLKLAMGDTTPMDAPTEMRPGTMGELVDQIADYDDSVDAIGYSMFYYATEMYLKSTVKLLGIDGVTPSAQTISDGSFAYITNYYAVVRKDTADDSDARRVIEWMLGDEAQQLASRANYVPLDPGNIQPPEPTYGYFGSTAENTTQSSGTGGTQSIDVRMEDCSYPPEVPSMHCEYDSDGNLSAFTYDGEEAMSAAVMEWAQGHPGSQSIQASQQFAVIDSRGDQDEVVSGIFSSAGATMTLSDFFYDSVNYISYINQNLFNASVNLDYFDWLNTGSLVAPGIAPHEPPNGFTGLPNDYPNFTVDPTAQGLLITFTFPDGNPFFAKDAVGVDTGNNLVYSNSVRMGLRIPSDLSPYGRISALGWTLNSAGQYYPVLTTTSTPSSSDDTVNGKIQTLVSENPEIGCFTPVYGSNRITILSYEDPDMCQYPEGPIDFPTVLEQWAFGTWEDSPMTEADLPDAWRTDVDADEDDPNSGIVCNLEDGTGCGYGFSFSSDASVRNVWSEGIWIHAIVLDGDSMYIVQYPLG